MIISKEQRESMLEAVKPAIKWLNDNCHPHTQLSVSTTGAELSEGIATVGTDEFLKD